MRRTPIHETSEQSTPENGWGRAAPLLGFAAVATVVAVGLEGIVFGTVLQAAAVAMALMLALVLGAFVLLVVTGSRQEPPARAIRIEARPDPRVSRAKHPRRPF
ncbi:hypothetical protein [Pararhodobacter sp. SW119]|uniref:hypothetical protein n=1 Tax=Pararhodobacter sp. SW119 TaxID=2780075 RepID=UPI001AE0AE5B|nr:hypothetical protein [Pararhodobacter sp. SW119]